MDTVRWILFESLIVLGIVLFLMNFATLVWWRRGGSVRPLLVTLVVALALLIVQAVVETHREVAARLLYPIRLEVVEGTTTALTRTLADDFVAGRGATDALSRAAFLALAERVVQRIQVRTVRQTALEVTSSDKDVFRVRVVYLSEIQHPQFTGLIKAAFDMGFRRDGGDWRIGDIVAPEINNRQLGSWSAADY